MDEQDFQEDASPSKSQRKREATALQDLGKQLVALPAEQLARMTLPEDLRSEVYAARRISSHGALRRQMQLIGKLMRGVDAEAIASQLAEVRGESNSAKAAFHALEAWRERLLQDDQVLEQWLLQHPHTDVQSLRQLIRNARREMAAGKPPKSSRALFRMLRELSGH